MDQQLYRQLQIIASEGRNVYFQEKAERVAEIGSALDQIPCLTISIKWGESRLFELPLEPAIDAEFLKTMLNGLGSLCVAKKLNAQRELEILK